MIEELHKHKNPGRIDEEHNNEQHGEVEAHFSPCFKHVNSRVELILKVEMFHIMNETFDAFQLK